MSGGGLGRHLRGLAGNHGLIRLGGRWQPQADRHHHCDHAGSKDNRLQFDAAGPDEGLAFGDGGKRGAVQDANSKKAIKAGADEQRGA